MSAFAGKADMAIALKCPLMTQSGHRAPLPGIQFYRYDGSSSALGAAMRRREFITLLSGTTVISADCGVGAAADDTGYWISRFPIP
jgi:hypothetical protein